jgi:hypothetical protein
LTESSQEVTTDEIQSVYRYFVKHVEVICSENDYTSIHRILNLTRIEFASLETLYLYEQGKKCA